VCRKRAIQICKNLKQTIAKIPENYDREYIFDPPQAKKNNLEKILDKLIKKYQIKKNEIRVKRPY
tara:strand:- start:267 stop:461 length:195 start_codon:yes stop_codon:yes gene_type:complete